MSDKQNQWDDDTRIREATHSQLQDWLVKVLDENTDLKRQLASRGDTSSFEYRGKKIIISPTTPAFVWDGKAISVLDAAPTDGIASLMEELESRPGGWEYKTVETGRKSGTTHEDVWPEGEGWEIDTTSGRVDTPNAGWDRLDHHEELYFRRRVPAKLQEGNTE